MDCGPHKPSDRLQVFEEITRKGECEPSHSLEIPANFDFSLLSMFGEVMEISGQKITYFDKRQASLAYSQLKPWFGVRFVEGPCDYLLIGEEDLSRLENYRSLVSCVERIGSLLAVHFFDIRMAQLLRNELDDEEEFIENEFLDNSFIGSEVSLNSESTVPSPYIYVSPDSETFPENKKNFFTIDVSLIGKDPRTTVMIKNIPNKYSQDMLLEAIDRHFAYAYDFFYLPIDSKVRNRQNKCNMGYAFINFLDCQTIVKFHRQFNGKKWERFNSEKICALAYARIQGRPLLLQHFQSSPLVQSEYISRH